MSTPTEVEIAWVSGIVEGEGSISLDPRHHGIQVSVSMTDEDVVVKLASVWGAKVYNKKPRGTWKPIYRTVLSGDNAVRWLKLMLPHLGERRSQRANEAIAQQALKISRHECGRRSALAKGCIRLTITQVGAIRALRGFMKQKDIAKQFGVTRMAISGVQTKRIWKGLP